MKSEVPLVRPTTGHRSGQYMEVVLIARHKYNEILYIKPNENEMI